MSSRPQIPSYQVIKDGDMSGNITSKITIIDKLSMLSYSYSWSGTSPVGTIIVEVSNDYSENPDGSTRNAGTWTTLTLSSPTNVSGNTGTGFIDVTQTGAYAIRTSYMFTSGVGMLQAWINAKVS